MYLTVMVLSQNYFKEKPQVGEWRTVVEETGVPVGRIVNTILSVKRIGHRIRKGRNQKPNKNIIGVTIYVLSWFSLK